MMEARAHYKYARISAQKARLVADMIRGIKVGKASEELRFSRKRAAKLIKYALDSAIANAEVNYGADVDELVVWEISVDEGPMFKRTKARAKGRANRILKRTCHINVTVAKGEERK